MKSEQLKQKLMNKIDDMVNNVLVDSDNHYYDLDCDNNNQSHYKVKIFDKECRLIMNITIENVINNDNDYDYYIPVSNRYQDDNCI